MNKITNKQMLTIRKLAKQQNFRVEDLCFNATGGRDNNLKRITSREASNIIVFLLRNRLEIKKLT
jgi:hypothetical protein